MSEIAKEGLTIVSKDNGLTLVSIVTDALQVTIELSRQMFRATNISRLFRVFFFSPKVIIVN